MADVVPSRTHVIVRPAWSCTACAKRKVKCDKQLPCSQCVKRNAGHLCTRDDEAVVGGQVGNGEVRELKEGMQILLKRLEGMERHLDAIRSEKEASTRHGTMAVREDTLQASSTASQSENTSVTLEYLALGKNRRLGILGGSRDPHTSTASVDILIDPSHVLEYPASARRILASDVVTKRILQQHAESVLWQHACVHSQTFERQLEVYFSLSDEHRWQNVEPLWIALLLSVIMITVHQMPSDVFRSLVFRKDEKDRQRMVEDALSATLRCLELGNYMARPSFQTCQTIAILSVCGHNVVDSNLLASLLAVAVKTAQTLNLHILGAEEASMKSEAAHFLETSSTSHQDEDVGDWTQRLVAFEMGKRVWWSLVQQDYFAIPFRGVSLVHYRQHDTPFPSNALDIDLDQGLLHVFENDYPTTTLKQRITSMSSDILCRFFDNLPRQDASWESDISPFESQFMRLLPAQQASFETDQHVPYVYSLKAYLEISIRHKMLVMHRAFCGRKPVDQSDVNRSKAVCVDMARGILMHCKAIVAQDDATMKVMWTTAYHAMAAATVLALDMFALAANASASSVRRMEVEEARGSLSKMSKRSPIAGRGVTLLDSLLSQFGSLQNTYATQSPVVARYDTSASSKTPRSPKRSRTELPTSVADAQSEWNWEDWSEYQSIVTMLQANPDIGRLFDGSLGNVLE